MLTTISPLRVLEGVVPIAADVGLGRAGAVVRAELEALARGEAPRQERALQRLGDVLFAMILFGVCDRQARATAELDCERQIALVEFVVFFGADKGERAEDMILRDDRHDDLRTIPQASHVQLVLPRCGVLHQGLLVDVREKEGLAGLRHAHDRMHAELFDIENVCDAGERLFAARIAVRGGGNEEAVGALVEQIENAQVGKRFNGKPGDVVERLRDIERLMKDISGSHKQCEPLLVAVSDGPRQTQVPQRMGVLYSVCAFTSARQSAWWAKRAYWPVTAIAAGAALWAMFRRTRWFESTMPVGPIAMTRSLPMCAPTVTQYVL